MPGRSTSRTGATSTSTTGSVGEGWPRLPCHDDGANWLVSNDYDNWRHGIESPNLRWEWRDGKDGGEATPCVEDDCGNR